MRLVLLLLVATVAHADAEICGRDDEVSNAVSALERFASDPSMKFDASYLDRCERDLVDPAYAKLAKRLLQACSTILGRDRDHPICIRSAIHQNKKGLMGVDFFTELEGWAHDPWKGGVRVLPLYAKLENRDAVARVLEVWKASIDEAAQREQTLRGWQRKHSRVTWTLWQEQAAAVFAALGDDDVITFLREQAKSKDGAVARACLDALRAINRRVEKANAPQP